MTIILGIDPGSRITGYGVIRSHGSKIEHLANGSLKVGTGELADRLSKIYKGLSEVIEQYQPAEMAIEQVFMAKNADSALKLGQARGVAIVASSNRGIPVAEYSARQVKQAVVGRGAAGKKQVQHMVTALLQLENTPDEDAADALAIAICHANTRTSLIYQATGRVGRRR